MRCESKRSCARRETQPDSMSGKASQRGAWPFWPQPVGNVVKTAPLVVTLLGACAAEQRACAGAWSAPGEAQATPCGQSTQGACNDAWRAPSSGPTGWACKGAHALLRSRVKPSRLDPRPRLACTPLQTQRRPVALPRRLLTQAASLGVVARLDWRCFNCVRTCKSSVNRP